MHINSDQTPSKSLHSYQKRTFSHQQKDECWNKVTNFLITPH